MSIVRAILRIFLHYDSTSRKVLIRPAGWLALGVIFLMLASALAFGGGNLARAFALRSAPAFTPEPTAASPTVPPRLEVSSSGDVVQVPLDASTRDALLEAFLRAWEWMYGGIDVLPNSEGLNYFAPLPDGVADPSFQSCDGLGWCLTYQKAETWLRACEQGRSVLFEESGPRNGWHLQEVYLLPSGDMAVLKLLRDPVRGRGRDLRTGEVREGSNPSFRYVVSLVRDSEGWKVARVVRYQP